MIRSLPTRPPAPSLPVTTTNGGDMSLIQKAILCAGITAIYTIAGCRSTSQPTVQPPEPSVAVAPVERAMPTDQPSAAVTQVVYQPETIAPGPQQTPSDELFVGSMELSLSQLVAEVEARNPSLQAMVAAWHAAAERYPQVVSLEDPMFMAMAAPASFDSNQVDSAYTLQVSQKIPWHGKRAARGRQACAEADAAGMDAEDSRLQLDDAARKPISTTIWFDAISNSIKKTCASCSRIAPRRNRDTTTIRGCSKMYCSRTWSWRIWNGSAWYING